MISSTHATKTPPSITQTAMTPAIVNITVALASMEYSMNNIPARNRTTPIQMSQFGLFSIGTFPPVFCKCND